jgi:type VI protein secretion system component Hcp
MSTKYYLKLDGISGAVKDKGYEKSLAVTDFWFQTADASDDAFADAGGDLGRPAYSREQLAALLEYSLASPKLFQATAIGRSFKTAVLYIVRAGAKPALLKKYSFYGVRISRYQTMNISNGDSLPADKIVLRFLRVT